MLEFEKKIMLTEEEYYTLLNMSYECLDSTVQVNYYFDTNDLKMDRNNVTYRIRFKSGMYYPTIKQHNVIDASSSYEKTFKPMEILDPTVFENDALTLHGFLVTERNTVIENENIKMFLDKNEYLGITDYELELEYSPNEEKRAFEILRSVADRLIMYDLINNWKEFSFRINAKPNKSSRFFQERAKEIKNVEISSITLNEKKICLRPDETHTLYAKILPLNATNRHIKWVSSNENVAKVDNGVVTAISQGQAIIIAISLDDSRKVDSCSVVVSDCKESEFFENEPLWKQNLYTKMCGSNTIAPDYYVN